MAKTRKNVKLAGLDQQETEPSVTYVCATSENTETSNQDDTNVVSKLPTRVGKEKCGDEHENLRLVKSCKRITAQCQKKSCSKSRKRKPSLAKVDIPEEVLTVQNKSNEKIILEKSSQPVPVSYENGAKQSSKESFKRAREVSAISLRNEKSLSCKKKMKVSFSSDTKSCLAEDHWQKNNNVSPQRLSEKVQGSSAVGISVGLTVKKLPLANGVSLRKCESITNKIQCAFCLSTEDSEVRP